VLRVEIYIPVASSLHLQRILPEQELLEDSTHYQVGRDSQKDMRVASFEQCRSVPGIVTSGPTHGNRLVIQQLQDLHPAHHTCLPVSGRHY
jgi:hypothetical protein